MIKPTVESFLYTASEIKEAVDTWAFYQGFWGERCSHCGLTANVLGGGPGWFCTCGAYNAQCFSAGMLPHAIPVLGPTSATIAEGHMLSTRIP